MNEVIGKILAGSKCPVCGADKRLYIPRFSIIKWKCTNEKCEKSKAWHHKRVFEVW